MTESGSWKGSLRLFFAERAAQINGTPSHEDLCYISGREPRLWSQPEMYEDMVDSILALTEASAQSTILEVGCAAGFIAKGVAPRVKRYVGVDLARPALRVARLLQLPNAEFRHSEGGKLPFEDATFDATFCYDVFTNFPTFDAGVPIIAEMLRVVKPGGKVLVGSIPDAACQAAYEERVRQFMLELDVRFGPLRPRPATEANVGLLQTISKWLSSTKPGITCYYFKTENFVSLGKQFGCHTKVCDIHSLNPYRGYRFNIVYTKNTA